MSSLVGANLGQYQIVEQIGRGGMATVYRARQGALGRDVAVKVLRDTLDPVATARFEREARAVASLHHPNILPLYDYGDDDGRRYLVTQYILGGRTLADEVAGGPLPPARALNLMALVLDALAYAHGRGIVHRDVKPANILLAAPEWPLLADFGIAESVVATTQLTLAGQIIGTANYMAPERASDRPADARSDLYSAGVVLFELLTGRLPFAGETPLAVLVQQVNTPPPSPRELVPALPESVEQTVLKALAKDPERRHQSAAELCAELRRLALELVRPAAPSPVSPSGGHATWAGHATDGAATIDAPPVAPPQAMGAPPQPASAVAPATVKGGPPQPQATAAAPHRASGEAPRPQATAAAPHRARAIAPQPPATVAAPRGPSPTQLGVTHTVGGASVPPTASTQAPASSARGRARLPLLAGAALLIGLVAWLLLRSGPLAGGLAVTLEDTAWEGGYRRSDGVYAGRSATWVYAAGTGYDSMRAEFSLPQAPGGSAELLIEGMDSEGPRKTEIVIAVNGQTIYNGPNPLPDDDFVAETGTWASHSFIFDAAILRAGANELLISNRSPGQFGQPPFFMLDYAVIRAGR